MAFLRHAKTSELPESQVEYREPGTAKHWLTLLAYIILALAVAVAVVLTARFVYRKVHHVNSNNTAVAKPAAASQNVPSVPNSTNNKSTSGSSSSSSGSNSSGSSKSTGTQAPADSSSTPKSSSSSPPPSSLPSNGPGDVIALFVGSSLVAAGIHYSISLRRADNEQ